MFLTVPRHMPDVSQDGGDAVLPYLEERAVTVLENRLDARETMSVCQITW